MSCVDAVTQWVYEKGRPAFPWRKTNLGWKRVFPRTFFCVSGISALLAPCCSGPGGTTRVLRCRWYQLYEANNFRWPDLPNCVTPLLAKLQVGMVILPLFSSEHEKDKGGSQQASFSPVIGPCWCFCCPFRCRCRRRTDELLSSVQNSDSQTFVRRGADIAWHLDQIEQLYRGFMWAGLDLPSI